MVEPGRAVLPGIAWTGLGTLNDVPLCRLPGALLARDENLVLAKILLHTLVFAPDGVSTAYLMTDLARQLQYLGHEVSVLTTTPHYNLAAAALDRQPMRAVWPGLLYRSDYEGIPIWHVKMPLKGQRVSERWLDYLRFHTVSLLCSLSVVGPYDIIIAPSPPLTMGVVSWLLGRRRKVSSIYNVQEIYPDFAINQGLIRHPYMVQAMQWLEQFVYARNTMVVPISEWFSRTLQQRRVPAQKLSVIPNFVDTALYRPLPRRNPFAEQHGLLEDFVVLYGGNIGLSQDWESVLFAAHTLVHLPIRFVIVGNGVRAEWLEREIKRRHLPNVSLFGYQPRELMAQINASSDIGTIPMRATTTSDTFPSKIYTIMACAKSAIVSADADSELAWVVQQSQCGRVVSPDVPQAYADAVLKAFHERQLLPAEGERGRRFVEQKYSKETIGQKYDQLIRTMLPSSPC